MKKFVWEVDEIPLSELVGWDHYLDELAKAEKEAADKARNDAKGGAGKGSPVRKVRGRAPRRRARRGRRR